MPKLGTFKPFYPSQLKKKGKKKRKVKGVPTKVKRSGSIPKIRLGRFTLTPETQTAIRKSVLGDVFKIKEMQRRERVFKKSLKLRRKKPISRFKPIKEKEAKKLGIYTPEEYGTKKDKAYFKRIRDEPEFAKKEEEKAEKLLKVVQKGDEQFKIEHDREWVDGFEEENIYDPRVYLYVTGRLPKSIRSGL